MGDRDTEFLAAAEIPTLKPITAKVRLPQVAVGALRTPEDTTYPPCRDCTMQAWCLKQGWCESSGHTVNAAPQGTASVCASPEGAVNQRSEGLKPNAPVVAAPST